MNLTESVTLTAAPTTPPLEGDAGHMEQAQLLEHATAQLNAVLEELGFTSLDLGAADANHELVRAYGVSAKNLAEKRFPQSDATDNVLRIAFTVIPSNSQNRGVVYAAVFEINGKTFTGNHDLNRSEFAGALVDACTSARFNVPYGELTWKKDYTEYAQQLREKLQGKIQ